MVATKRQKTVHIFSLFSFIFVVWAAFRYFPEPPLWLTELVLKPIIWLLPTLFIVFEAERKSFSSLGYTTKNLFPSLYWGIGLGILFSLEGFLVNVLKYRGPSFISFDHTGFAFLGFLGLSLATAISEETVFRGYIFSRLRFVWKNEWLANGASAFLFSLIHLPIGVFVLGYTPSFMLVYLFFIFVYGSAAAFVFARTGNIISSILLHIFWSWPIILFR